MDVHLSVDTKQFVRLGGYEGCQVARMPETPIVVGIGRVADYQRVRGLTVGASDVESAFSVEDGEPGLVHENAARISKLDDSAFIAREQKHSVCALNLLYPFAEAGLRDG